MIGAGTVLAGRYRLEQHVASGGMGEVWRGFDRVLGRTVAVKCLRAPSDEPSFVDRFRAEARTMATISHPGVVEVYDFGDDPAAGVYLVMKYVDGESLANVLARDGRLSAAATMRLVAEAAEALHAAHEKGVTHRDVKPANLLRRLDGSTVLTDFGIARSAGATRHTSTGSLLGTGGYIAPERATGQPATARSDIYSLGVVAYRCLAGHLPFVGESVVELALRHANDEPPPLPADVPPGVRAVVERAMAKDPAARWPSAAVFAAEARRAVAPAPTQRHALAPTQRQTAVVMPTRGQPISRKRRDRGLLVGGAAALVVAIVATVAVILVGDGDQQNPSASPSGTNPAVLVGGSTPTADPGTTSPAADPGGTRPAADPGGTGPADDPRAVPPSVPADLTATPISPSTIRLQWTDNSADEDGFTVFDGQASNDVGANTTSYDWTGFRPAYRSCFKVRAYNSSGASAFFPTADGDWVCTETLPGSGPPVPTGLTATPINPSTIRLQWTSTPGAEGFTIHDGITTNDVGAVTSYDWTGFSPGFYSCFRIRSFNSSGASEYSGWSCATTPM